MDTDQSRNVNGLPKYFCEGKDEPFCTDDPFCQDLGIFPGTITKYCASVCVDNDVSATTKVNHNGYQFHYVVSCSCGDGTSKYGDDFILFGNQDYMKSCSGDGSNSLKIKKPDNCDAYCVETLVFDGGEFASSGGNKTCSCLHPEIQTIDPATKLQAAMACDDSTARANDGSGLGNPCYENVGVDQIECSTPSAARFLPTHHPRRPRRWSRRRRSWGCGCCPGRKSGKKRSVVQNDESRNEPSNTPTKQGTNQIRNKRNSKQHK